MAAHPVLIVGGGIAGLASALSLSRQGQHVVVLEREAHFSEAGAGLQLGPNAVAALKAIDAWDAVEPCTSQPPEIHMRDGRSGALLKRLPLGHAFERHFGGPYRVARRTDLHAALLATCRASNKIELRTQSMVNDVEQSSSGVVVQKKIVGTFLLAADGVHSNVRQSLFPASAPVNSGLMFHRALQTVSSRDGIELDCVTLWMLPGGHVVHYPVGKAGLLNLVCVTDARSSPEDITNVCCAPLTLLLQHMSWTQWSGLYVQPLPTWQVGRVLLLGDAAHGTLPFLAQGAAMALEDAASLRMGDGVVALSEMRLARTKKLHAQTLAAGRAYHLSGLRALARNAVLRAMPNVLLQAQLKWIYSAQQ